jgi:drug/metabolite transporter (DMT)-like permease
VTNPDRAVPVSPDADFGARLMLVLLCLIWGITWPLMKIALNEFPPLTMRAAAAILGAATYYFMCVLMRRSLRIPSPKIWAHILVGSVLNIVAFSLFSAFAQLAASTSRVTILAYTMPIWSVLLAWVFLGERPNRMQATALVLCAAGLVVLIYPLTANGVPLGIVYALAVGVCWAGGTIYLKWAHIEADQMGVGSWQMTVAAVIIVACMLGFEGRPRFGGAHLDGILATAWTGIPGNGIAYALWFTVVRRLPAVTASLGVLAVPVVGVISSSLILREVPTVADMIGFALIFVASACVLLTVPSVASKPSRAG